MPRRLLTLCALFLLLHPSLAQQPCRDTLVHLYDTICEGTPYYFHGRQLTYSGVFFDTLPRVGTSCDSVIMLRLDIMDLIPVAIHPQNICKGDIGYNLYGYGGLYNHWSSQPYDSSLAAQQYLDMVHINPLIPTTYTLTVDYSPTPLCPSRGSVTINPIETIESLLRVSPEVLTYNNMELTVEDIRGHSQGAYWGGGAVRCWYINGIKQDNYDEYTTFQISPYMGDTIELMMEAFSATCLDTVVRRIPFKRIALFFPNIFTPDGEDNNRFIPLVQGILDYELWIYDRHGVMVFHTSDMTLPWDGCRQADGHPCQPGTYVYLCRYRDIDTPAGYQTTQGTITLIR